MTMRLAGIIFLLCLFLSAGEANYRAVLLPPDTQTTRMLTFTLAVRTDGANLLVSAHIRNDSAEEFTLRPEQVALGEQRPRDFGRRTVLPDAGETITWRFRCVSGNHTLRILDLEFPLLVKASRPEIPYYREKSTVYDFSQGRLWRRQTGAGLLIIDDGEQIQDALLRLSGGENIPFTAFDYAHWLVTKNIEPAPDSWLLIKTKSSPDVYQVFDLRGRPML